MKIYRANISYSDGVLVMWGANKRTLEQQAAAYCKENEADFLHVMACDIPTDKVGLIAWLNAHFDTDTDNG